VADTHTHGGTPSSTAGTAFDHHTLIADDVCMTYKVFQDRHPSVRDLVMSGFKTRQHREIRAVRHVSFTAHAGEVIGIIGRNGSGKSTLLRGLAGLQPVTSGAIYAVSEPVLLGVGAALQKALSGRRNIELGALALGMPVEEVRARTQEIAVFAGLEDHLDLPLKAYSSGMRARLHFAIASAVEPEILLIDEALAVGDADFKERSGERINELKEQAGTVFIVSHSLGSLREQCSRMLWLDDGEVVADGQPDEVVRSYKRFVRERRREKGR
jgi:teichoic acid transport system ATP-binding protein